MGSSESINEASEAQRLSGKPRQMLKERDVIAIVVEHLKTQWARRGIRVYILAIALGAPDVGLARLEKVLPGAGPNRHRCAGNLAGERSGVDASHRVVQPSR
jgi:hypothetical protein